MRGRGGGQTAREAKKTADLKIEAPRARWRRQRAEPEERAHLIALENLGELHRFTQIKLKMRRREMKRRTWKVACRATETASGDSKRVILDGITSIDANSGKKSDRKLWRRSKSRYRRPIVQLESKQN
jgi:hypothetical protein